MMGLLGNVAEVKGLRKDLMNEEYVTVFNSLLQMHIDGIEVTFKFVQLKITHIFEQINE